MILYSEHPTTLPVPEDGRALRAFVVKREMATPCGVAIRVIGVRRCPTLPQGPPCSTIGAESLSFRVRNVTGRFPLAMAAETLLICIKKVSRNMRTVCPSCSLVAVGVEHSGCVRGSRP